LPDILCFLFLPFIHSWRILDDFLIPGAQAKIAFSALCDYSLGYGWRTFAEWLLPKVAMEMRTNSR
jgi:hypothetical protein